MTVLRAVELNKSYKKRKVIKSVSFEVHPGQIVGLLGPNGAGKTTCFYMIVGLIAADRGKVLLGQEELTQIPIHGRAKKGIGYLPQEASVFRKLSVRDNILSILETRKELSDPQRQEKLSSLLNEFHLADIQHTMGISLSGGERRRVEIARALACEPSFILLDEPFAGVDPISVVDIKKQIAHLARRGIGILITDHNVRETMDICDQAYIVNEGHVIACGTPAEVLQNKHVKEVYLGEQFSL